MTSDNLSIEFYYYSAYGLIISTNTKLPGFVAAPKQLNFDVKLYLGFEKVKVRAFRTVIEINYQTAISAKGRVLTPKGNDSSSNNYCYRIRYWNGLEFVVNANGTEIWVQCPEESVFDFAVSCFSGPVLGFILRLQGILCLHASVIEIDQHAIALLAPSGGGKSTTAAALALKGYSVLSDDILVIKRSGTRYLAVPGTPGIRLCQDSVDYLFDQTKNQILPALNSILNPTLNPNPNQVKLNLDLPQSGCRISDEPIPIVAMYTRGSDEQPPRPDFRTSTQAESLLTLLRHTYPGHYYKLPVSLRADEFKQLQQLNKKAPLREVTYQRQFARLPDLCDALAADARQLIRQSV